MTRGDDHPPVWYGEPENVEPPRPLTERTQPVINRTTLTITPDTALLAAALDVIAKHAAACATELRALTSSADPVGEACLDSETTPCS